VIGNPGTNEPKIRDRAIRLRMPSARTRRTIRLLASTSVIAMSLSIAPVTVSFHHHGVSIVKMAQADSCFVAGTRVLMADGSEKPIEEIVVGDRVMGVDGQANRVTAIERPRLAGRPLHGFNGGRPFVTAEHPFRTLGGWKSIDPMATRSENARLRVARLAVGDMLVAAAAPDGATRADGALAASPSTAPALQYVALRALTAVPADPETVVYNLILDGDHSYFADRFLVHNKGGEGGDGGDGGEGSGSGSDGSGSGSDGSGSRSDGSGSGSDGGESSGSSGSGSDGGESGDSSGESGESGDDSGNSGKSSSNSGTGSSNSGKGNASSGQSEGRAGGFSGGLGKVGSDLSKDEEASAIANGWQ